ncbi:acyltransferase family protein [Alteromonas sp. S005]|uniref:acyltransferase family protein n=1 Tax=Alteromonas sp. S005 TaxID=3117400 RepID=UPI002FDFCD9F
MHDKHFSYRPDIDGLRAIAVLSVVIYHAFPSLIPGGFIGVDIFFVISGFLITSILQRELIDSTFSIRRFYERRVKRLFPALIMVLLFVTVCGWVLLLSHEFASLGKYLVASVAFFANISFWHESSDYFNTASELKPLLHLWSLGVEEQFYIVWPLILAIVIKLKWRFELVALVLATGSFILSIATVKEYQSFAFYLPFTRFWELAAGGILAAFSFSKSTVSITPQNKTIQDAMSLLGLALIIMTLAVINHSSVFPGWWAVPPTLGTVLLIWSGPESCVAKLFTTHKVFVFIGLISYPLYLWHWPLLSFARIVYESTPPATVSGILVITSILLAWLTYQYIEKPLRHYSKKPNTTKKLLISLCYGMSIFLIIGLLAYTKSIPVRLQSLSNTISTAVEDWDTVEKGVTVIKEGSENGVLFIGDSYIQQLSPRVSKLYADAPESLRPVTFSVNPGCAPITGIERVSISCADDVRKSYELANKESFSTVVIGGSWWGLQKRGDYYLADQTNTNMLNLQSDEILTEILKLLYQDIEKLKQSRKKIYLVMNPPGGDLANPTRFIDRIMFTPKPAVKMVSLSQHQERVIYINSKLASLVSPLQIELIYPEKWICDDLRCHFTDSNGIPYYKDATHFRSTFVATEIKGFDSIIKR